MVPAERTYCSNKLETHTITIKKGNYHEENNNTKRFYINRADHRNGHPRDHGRNSRTKILSSIENAEASAEDAVITAIRAGLKQYANNSLLEHGQETWPENPFDALADKPAGYTTDGTKADADGEWTFILPDGGSGAVITHQRADNSRWIWNYDKGTQGGGDDAAIGTLSERVAD